MIYLKIRTISHFWLVHHLEYLNTLDLSFRYLHGIKAVTEINLADINGNPIGTSRNKNRLFQLPLEMFLKS